jgi:hypothetical protein
MRKRMHDDRKSRVDCVSAALLLRVVAVASNMILIMSNTQQFALDDLMCAIMLGMEVLAPPRREMAEAK